MDDVPASHPRLPDAAGTPGGDARSVELAAAPGMAGVPVRLLRDDDETDGEFERRNASFSALLRLAFR